MCPNCLNHVGTTGRVEPAPCRQERGDRPLVEPNSSDQESGNHRERASEILATRVSNERAAVAKSEAASGALALITRSSPVGSWGSRRRKTSRSTRLIRLRVTAPTPRIEIASPSRVMGRPLRRQPMCRTSSETPRRALLTARNSAPLRRRAVFLKRSRGAGGVTP